MHAAPLSLDTLERSPNSLRAHWQFAKPSPNCISNRIANCSRTRHDRRLTNAARTKRAKRRRILNQDHFHVWNLLNLGKIVIHKRTGKQLAIAVIEQRLMQTPTNTLRHSAMDLTLHHRGIQSKTHILYRN